MSTLNGLYVRRFHTCIESRFLNELIFVSPSTTCIHSHIYPILLKWAIDPFDIIPSILDSSFSFTCMLIICAIYLRTNFYMLGQNMGNRERGFSFPYACWHHEEMLNNDGNIYSGENRGKFVHYSSYMCKVVGILKPGAIWFKKVQVWVNELLCEEIYFTPVFIEMVPLSVHPQFSELVNKPPWEIWVSFAAAWMPKNK